MFCGQALAGFERRRPYFNRLGRHLSNRMSKLRSFRCGTPRASRVSRPIGDICSRSFDRRGKPSQELVEAWINEPSRALAPRLNLALSHIPHSYLEGCAAGLWATSHA